MDICKVVKSQPRDKWCTTYLCLEGRYCTAGWILHSSGKSDEEITALEASSTNVRNALKAINPKLDYFLIYRANDDYGQGAAINAVCEMVRTDLIERG